MGGPLPLRPSLVQTNSHATLCSEQATKGDNHLSELADLFADGSAPKGSAGYPDGKLDAQLKTWKESNADLYEKVIGQLRNPRKYSSTSIENGFARIGFACSSSTILKWRRRNLDVTR